jgi:hypothetical protein
MAERDRTPEALEDSALAGGTPVVVVKTVEMATRRKLTRNDVAALMGVSPSTVIRRERQGVLRAELVDGVHLFDETEVRRTITTSRHRTAIATLGGASGDVAALVFSELDAGVNEVEIVKRHAIAPAVVKSLVAQYREFRGEVAISLEELTSLREELRVGHEANSQSSPRAPTCLVCGRPHRVRACAVCLADPGAMLERQISDGVESVRLVVETDEGRSCVSDWTPTTTPREGTPACDMPTAR